MIMVRRTQENRDFRTEYILMTFTEIKNIIQSIAQDMWRNDNAVLKCEVGTCAMSRGMYEREHMHEAAGIRVYGSRENS